MQTPIYIIIGTRAQLIKMAPIILLLEKEELLYHFIYTQQHKETIEDLLKNFGIVTKPQKIVRRDNEAKTIKLFAGWFLQMFWILINPFSRKKIFTEGRGLVIVHGDTASAAWGAVYGRTSFCKVMHVESGLRSFNLFKPFPEEIMRVITFLFSNYYACPNKWAVSNLKRFPGEKVNLGSNPMYDSLIYGLKTVKSKDYRSKLRDLSLPKKFALVSIHRYENIFKQRRFEMIISQIIKAAQQIPIVMILHPSTERQIKKINSYGQLEESVHLLPRLDFLTFIEVADMAEFVITDGGSNQEEMSYLGKPTLLFREVTERKEGLGRNVILSKFDTNIIKEFLRNYKRYKYPPLQLKKSPSSVCVDFIQAKIA